MGRGALVSTFGITVASRVLGGWFMLFLLALLYAGGAALFETLDAAMRGDLPWNLVLPCLDRLTPRVLFNAAVWSSAVYWVSLALMMFAMWLSDRFRARAQE